LQTQEECWADICKQIAYKKKKAKGDMFGNNSPEPKKSFEKPYENVKSEREPQKTANEWSMLPVKRDTKSQAQMRYHAPEPLAEESPYPVMGRISKTQSQQRSIHYRSLTPF